MRYNDVRDSVAGIEIENSGNGRSTATTRPTTPPACWCSRTAPCRCSCRECHDVHHNLFENNNTPNFGAGHVAGVPDGTGCSSSPTTRRRSTTTSPAATTRSASRSRPGCGRLRRRQRRSDAGGQLRLQQRHDRQRDSARHRAAERSPLSGVVIRSPSDRGATTATARATTCDEPESRRLHPPHAAGPFPATPMRRPCPSSPAARRRRSPRAPPRQPDRPRRRPKTTTVTTTSGATTIGLIRRRTGVAFLAAFALLRRGRGRGGPAPHHARGLRSSGHAAARR